ncbi:hypothetical protein PTKIN_Ptkin19aG0029700 [Pterospermum kingtungense]
MLSGPLIQTPETENTPQTVKNPNPNPTTVADERINDKDVGGSEKINDKGTDSVLGDDSVGLNVGDGKEVTEVGVGSEGLRIGEADIDILDDESIFLVKVRYLSDGEDDEEIEVAREKVRQYRRKSRTRMQSTIVGDDPSFNLEIDEFGPSINLVKKQTTLDDSDENEIDDELGNNDLVGSD